MTVAFEPTASIDVKQHNTFRLAGAFKNDDGSPMDMSGVSLSAFIRNARDTKICEVTITPVGNGFLEFRLPKGVVLPLGTAYMDVYLKQTIAGEVVERNTDIIEINVKKVVTHG